MIRISDLRKRYPSSNRDVLAGVDVTIDGGEFVSLVGRSGCGKTTLLNIIGGLDRRWDGAVEVMGHVLSELGDVELARYRRNVVGFVFQAYHLLDHLSCRENVALSARFAGRREQSGLTAEKRRAEEVLDHVGLAGAAEFRPSRLSGGERQRVAIARALFNRPRLLLLDEPTGNLDNATGADILDLLTRLHADGGLTLIAATHDGSIETAGGRMLRMTEGVVVPTAEDKR